MCHNRPVYVKLYPTFRNTSIKKKTKKKTKKNKDLVKELTMSIK